MVLCSAGGMPKLRHRAGPAFAPLSMAPKWQMCDTSLAGRKGKCSGPSDQGKDCCCLDDVTKEGRGQLFVQLWEV